MSSLPPETHRAAAPGRLPSNRRAVKAKARHIAPLLAALMLPIMITACGDGSGTSGVDNGSGSGNGSGNGSGGGNGSGNGSGGGNTPSGYTLSGTVSGLNETGLVLTNGSDTITVPAGATSFALSTPMTSGTAYQVAVGTQPLWQKCTVTHGSGTMAGANVTDVAVACAQAIHVSIDAGANSTPADGPAHSAGFQSPFGVAVDGNGNRYVSEPFRSVIRKIAANGTVTTIGAGSQGATDGAADVATFNIPFGLAADAAGNVFVADAGNHKIRKIAPDGTVSTVAGDGTTSVFFGPVAVAVDAAGNLFVTDQQHHRIAKVAPNGTVTTLAGSGTPGDADGAGTAAQFTAPVSIAIDGGTLYVTEQKNRVRKVTADGTVSTLAGAGAAGFADGPGAQATFSQPIGIAAYQGNVYVVDGLQGETFYGDRIRRIKPDGTVSTFVPAQVQGAPCCFDGGVGTATLNLPGGLAVDAAGDLLVTQGGDLPAVRRISRTEPEVSTLASIPGLGAALDVATDRNGNSYVSVGATVAKVSADGTVSTLAGSSVQGFADGPGAQARFRRPAGVAVDASGNVYVGDRNDHRVRKIAPDGTVSTLAGTGVRGFADGPAASAQFSDPDGVAVDASGNVYVFDSGQCRLRKITPDGNVTSVAGTGTCGVAADGVGEAAGFGYPQRIALDGGGNVYVADSDVGVRKVTPDSTVTTLAMLPNVSQNWLSDVAVDASGNVYVATENDRRLHRIGTDGTVVHFAGVGEYGNADGPRSSARIGDRLIGIDFDSRGYIVAVDYMGEALLRRISTAPGTLPARGGPRG